MRIFQRLEQEELERRAEKEFQENLRNDLYFEEGEQLAQERLRQEIAKKDRQRKELQEAADLA